MQKMNENDKNINLSWRSDKTILEQKHFSNPPTVIVIIFSQTSVTFVMNNMKNEICSLTSAKLKITGVTWDQDWVDWTTP